MVLLAGDEGIWSLFGEKLVLNRITFVIARCMMKREKIAVGLKSCTQASADMEQVCRSCLKVSFPF